MTIPQLKNIILAAFVNVKLDGGVSLRQIAEDDPYDGDQANATAPLLDITNSWREISREYLERYAYVAYLDAEGFRYCIPALMISVLDDYEAGSLRVIGTLLALHPQNETEGLRSRQYSLLNAKQKEAIALFLAELPNLIKLDLHDQRNVPRALHNYWAQFLPKQKEG